jgi:hypothetical protein
MTKSEQREKDWDRFINLSHKCDRTCKNRIYNFEQEECCTRAYKYIHKQDGKICEEYEPKE